MSGFLSAKSCLTASHTSPTSSTLGKRKQHPACKKAAVNVPQPAARVSGVPIRAHNAADSWAGRRVLVYWPADNQWWEATLCRVSAGLLAGVDTHAGTFGMERHCSVPAKKLVATAAGGAAPAGSSTSSRVSDRRLMYLSHLPPSAVCVCLSALACVYTAECARQGAAAAVC